MASVKGAKINWKSIEKKVGASKKTRNGIDDAARKKFDAAKKQLISDFDKHAVTRELIAGPDSGNLSDTLGGYGNLFSYMGFPSGATPTTAVRNFLIQAIKLKRSSNRAGLNVNYNINVPSLKDFSFASMPWETGKNWVEAVETGVSGFSYYLARAAAASRSGTAIQIDGTLRAKTSSAGIKYVSKLLKDLKKNIGRKGKK